MTNIITFILVFISTFGLYPQTMKVSEVNLSMDTIVLEDETGNIWEWEDELDLQENDVVSCIMYDNGTKNIVEDDWILILR